MKPVVVTEVNAFGGGTAMLAGFIGTMAGRSETASNVNHIG
jgi:hypothetical protein